MKTLDIRAIIIRLITISIIVGSMFLLYNTKIKSRELQESQIREFEENLTLESDEEKGIYSLAETKTPVGVLYIPKINLKIAIFGDSTEKSLSKGVGIIEGTGTLEPKERQNTILTTHNGDSRQDLFINLNKLKLEDDFYVRNDKNKTYKYKIINIKVAEPVSEQKYWTIGEKSRITLRTCTPTGINSHRLLVTGELTEFDGIIPKSKFILSNYELQLVGLSLVSLIFFILTFKRKKDDHESEDYYNWEDFIN